MSYYEYSVHVPTMYISPTFAIDEPEILISISAVGGGTAGEAYAHNSWEYAVYYNHAKLISGSDLRSGASATHAQMAATLASFLGNAGESLHYSGTDSEYAEEYDETQRAFLEFEYERLELFAYDAMAEGHI